MDEHRTQVLLDDPELALRSWYESMTPGKDEDLVLTSGAGPSVDGMRRAFDAWFQRREDEFRTLICVKMGYARLTSERRLTSEIAVVTAVSSALAATSWGGQIDPVATAAVLVSSQALTKLCADLPQT